MATDSIRVSTVIPAHPERVYRAWLDAGEHGAFTGSKATGEPIQMPPYRFGFPEVQPLRGAKP